MIEAIFAFEAIGVLCNLLSRNGKNNFKFLRSTRLNQPKVKITNQNDLAVVGLEA